MKKNYSTLKPLSSMGFRLFAVLATVLFAAHSAFAVKCPNTGIQPTPTASPGTTTCQNGSAITLGATVPFSGSGGTTWTIRWYSSASACSPCSGGTLVGGPSAFTVGAGSPQVFPGAAQFNVPLSTAGTFYYYYEISVTGCTNPTYTSSSITITVTPQTAITTPPTTTFNRCYGTPFSISLVAVGTGLSYSWQYVSTSLPVANNTPAGTTYSGQGTNTLTVTGMPPGSYPNYFKCVVSGTCAPLTVTTSNINVTIGAMTNMSYVPALEAYVDYTSAPGTYYPPVPGATPLAICYRTNIDFFWSNAGSAPYPIGVNAMGTFQINGTPVDTVPPNLYSNNTIVNGDVVRFAYTFTGTPTYPTCYNPGPYYSGTYNFTVYPSDPPDVTTSAVPASGCVGQNVTFTGVPSGGTGANPTYQWFDFGVPISTASNANSTFTTSSLTAGVHSITCEIVSSDTCSSPMSVMSVPPISYTVGLCYDTVNTNGWTTINRCGGVFYDNGGPANYLNVNSNGATTICPTSPGQYVTATFTSFATQAGVDYLRIFSGPDTTSGFLQQLSGTPAIACATFTSAHSGGCLSFHWVSNNVTNNTGWVANLACASTPSPITPGLNCSNPINISSLPYSINGQTNNCFGNNHAGGAPCATTNVSGSDNYYRYDAISAECITAIITGATNNSISLNIYQGCPGVGTCIAAWSTAVGGSLGGQATLPAPGTYYIVVDANTGVTFNYNLTINTFGSAPLNDLVCDAEPLVMTIPHYDDNSCAGTETGTGIVTTCLSGNFNTLWYSFVATSTQARIRFVRGVGTLTDPIIQVYKGSSTAPACGSLTYLGCNDDGTYCGVLQDIPYLTITTGISAGDTCFIRVDGFGNNVGSYQIVVDDPTAVVPAYGYDCGNPILVSAQQCTYGSPAFIGIGDQCDFPCGNTAGFVCERDGVYFLFQTQAGLNGANFLTFDIYSDPSVTTDWDFIIWNVTSMVGPPATYCSYLQSGAWNTTSGQISSSWVDTWQAPANGHTGCRQGYAAVINGFPFNAPIPLSGTQWWLLYVSNFRFGQFPYGFSLDFSYPLPQSLGGGPGAVIYNPAAPPQMIWWTGQAGTTDWFNTANWGGCAVPSCANSTSATIASVYSPGLQFPVINAAGAVTKDLTIKPGGSLTIASTRNIDVCGNWLNIGTFTANSGSSVTCIGSNTQYFDGSMAGSNSFANLTMNKSLAPLRHMNLYNKAEASGLLGLNTGRIITGAKELHVTNNAPGSVPIGSATSFVQGNLRRNINNAGGVYYYPIGISSVYELAKIEFTTATTIPNILGYFKSWNSLPAAGPASMECLTNDYSTLAPLNHGYWTFTPSSNPTSGDYNMTLYNTGYSNSGASNAWTVMKAASTAGPWSLSGVCNGTSSVTQTKRDGMNGFSVFASAQSGNPLPIELLTVQASLVDVGVDVTWETASETNNDYFDIERSRDGVNFEKIGVKKGAGNSSVNLFYSHNDPEPFTGINYYRLRQVDFDGRFSYSDVVYVSKPGPVTLYPNPANTYVSSEFFTSASGTVQFEILDVLGKVYISTIEKAAKGANKFSFSISDLPGGVYFMKLKPVDSEIIPATNIRFVKQARQE